MEIADFVEGELTSISEDGAYDALANGLYDLGYEIENENEEDEDEAIENL